MKGIAEHSHQVKWAQCWCRYINQLGNCWRWLEERQNCRTMGYGSLRKNPQKRLNNFVSFLFLTPSARSFFGILAQRLSFYCVNNGYIDSSVQKGSIAGMPDFLECIGVLTQLQREARKNTGDLTVLWLNLEKAYGSIPHKLMVEALEWHHAPSIWSWIITIIFRWYYHQKTLRLHGTDLKEVW